MDTVRRRIIELLRREPLTAREISQELGVSEREVYAHLPHAAKTASAGGEKLVVVPFSCLDCGFSFVKRNRFTAPGRCPVCKSSHLEKPSFRVL